MDGCMTIILHLFDRSPAFTHVGCISKCFRAILCRFSIELQFSRITNLGWPRKHGLWIASFRNLIDITSPSIASVRFIQLFFLSCLVFFFFFCCRSIDVFCLRSDANCDDSTFCFCSLSIDHPHTRSKQIGSNHLLDRTNTSWTLTSFDLLLSANLVTCFDRIRFRHFLFGEARTMSLTVHFKLTWRSLSLASCRMSLALFMLAQVPFDSFDTHFHFISHSERIQFEWSRCYLFSIFRLRHVAAGQLLLLFMSSSIRS